MKKILLGAAAALVMGISGAANSAIVQLPWANVDFSTVDSNNFGGCMVRINQRIDTVTAGECPSRSNGAFLTFSCTGEVQEYEKANKLFETAQMAQALSKQIRFTVDTNLRHNNYCVIVRADIE